jgi:hypothetical protein
MVKVREVVREATKGHIFLLNGIYAASEAIPGEVVAMNHIGYRRRCESAPK